MATTFLTHPMLTTASQTAVEASLHTADPGTTGASEVSGAPYTRQPVTWLAPSGGSITSEQLVFDMPAIGSASVTHVGMWDAGGNFLEAAPVAVPQPFPSPGTATVSPLTMSLT